MKQIGRIYLTPQSTIEILEGSTVNFHQIDDVQISSSFFPSGMIFFAWHSNQALLKDDVWRALPRFDADCSYRLKLDYSSIGCELTFRIVFFDQVDQVLGEYYSQANELEFTGCDYNHYQIEVSGHQVAVDQDSTIHFKALDCYQLSDKEPAVASVQTIDWQIEVGNRPQYLAVVIQGHPENETTVRPWLLPQETISGVVIHVSDYSPVIGELNAEAELALLEQRIQAEQQIAGLTARQCFVVGIGVNAKAAIRLAMRWQYQALIADPLLIQSVPNSLPVRYHRLVQQRAFDYVIEGTFLELMKQSDRSIQLVLLANDQRNQTISQQLPTLPALTVKTQYPMLPYQMSFQYNAYAVGIKAVIQQLIKQLT
ncbi:accessory Sec system protein Asp3 [Latilactobacillus curvatus]|uniref:accessory Sec system protein Asp3 n=1 Tax=Latilactobacillus curvatus TaxID=28038 RepID=UPI000B620944|nr:accessory Sec system protein Asp3 [Latilactobacillus curvatus]ASN61734.1 hypothetical protein CGZ47_03935 [Latilactobacillus curvatus]AZP96209.1 hypothetical protein CYK59_04255 [Latilactobacillus curvatus]MCT2879853.1 hypothetical protein [Latilactobacillus curvatus]